VADTVRQAVLVGAPLDRAFALFTQGFGTWWPREYTWAREKLDTIAIEPREGGRCFERGPHGFQADWGRVLTWDPPHRLVFRWQISPGREPVPDPDAASEVEVRFEAEDAQSTRVELEHRGFEKHGEGGAGYAAAMGSERGWPLILDRYASAAGELAGGEDAE
jgi:uncharacterized protein YndB with AHSA1/START domain